MKSIGFIFEGNASYFIQGINIHNKIFLLIHINCFENLNCKYRVSLPDTKYLLDFQDSIFNICSSLCST